MGKYKPLKTFRDGDKWYKQGEVVELTDKKASELIKYQAIMPTLDDAASLLGAPKVETAEKKLGNEIATQPTGNVAHTPGKGK